MWSVNMRDVNKPGTVVLAEMEKWSKSQLFICISQIYVWAVGKGFVCVYSCV